MPPLSQHFLIYYYFFTPSSICSLPFPYFFAPHKQSHTRATALPCAGKRQQPRVAQHAGPGERGTFCSFGILEIKNQNKTNFVNSQWSYKYPRGQGESSSAFSQLWKTQAGEHTQDLQIGRQTLDITHLARLKAETNRSTLWTYRSCQNKLTLSPVLS